MLLFGKKKTSSSGISDDIENAVKGESTHELDSTLIFTICGKMGASKADTKEAIKLLQKRMLDDDPRVQTRALQVLTTLLDNTPNDLTEKLSGKSFGKALKQLADKNQNDPVHVAMMQFLGACAKTLHPLPMDIESVYMKFSPTGGARPRDFPGGQAAPHTQAEPRQQNPESLMELASNNAQLFSDILAHTDPTEVDITKHELIQENHRNCKMIQADILRFLERSKDDVTNRKLINANEKILASFIEYDQMVERAAMFAATEESQKVNHRGKQKAENHNPFQSSSGVANGNGESRVEATPSSSFLPAAEPRTIMSDPFDDLNVPATASPNAGNLPAPLTPEVVHR